ncbi:HAD family hydrolase [Halotalea alkalilenta]|uniref:Haloacid dehalogenase n=1 Tax=Halotalea alkalilenta TaxID=376489 RepID=A0A172YBY3_9GAMM|nr:HAD family hydrolase [Halotalea alkalilenta]ANF56759.1 hypothetical protein A5892_04155 [Halotalea alkalilenta]
MRLDALTFDIDDTLWDNGPVMAHLEAEHYRWLDERIQHADAFPLEEYAARRMAFAATLTDRRGDVTYVRREVLHRILLEHGIQEPDARALTEQAINYMLELRHRVEPYPEVDPLLEALAKRYRLAVITNGNVDVTRLPLARHFDVCFKAGEIGMPKPDERVFLHALEALGGIDPRHAIHVGDSWEHDIEPAARLGMQAVWIDIFDQPRPLPGNVHRVRHVRELPKVLERLEGA